MKVSSLISVLLINGTISPAFPQNLPTPPRPKFDNMPSSLAPQKDHVPKKEAFASEIAAELQNTMAGPTRQWVARYNFANANLQDIPTAITLSPNGFIGVTGYHKNAKGNWDYLTLVYNNTGGRPGVYRQTNNSDELAYGAAFNDSGIWVTGQGFGGGNQTDVFTITYAGNRQYRYDGAAHGNDGAFDIKLDAAGNFYVTGYTYRGVGVNDYDIVTIKYASNGVLVWVALYDGPGHSDDNAYELALDNAGNIYVTGYSTGKAKSKDFTTVKYNSAGVQQWVARYNAPSDTTDIAYGIALDANNNVYVTGYSIGAGGNFDYLTIKYNTNGVQQWLARYNGPGLSLDGAIDIAVDPIGATPNVYVTGRSTGVNANEDICTIKYNSAGLRQWVARYNGLGNGHDGANRVLLGHL